ncbi:hypothetical protein B6U74_03595 [Candidatus Bathyarchaeota archaeon ex4484_205]|nr:MAG: hypothetical protein B6U74_03595 [Candidatus Bathyarchaeota archaeon ex4484_205]RLG69088.1 MAG: hypothetical protein DRN93_01045 [archaeon]
MYKCPICLSHTIEINPPKLSPDDPYLELKIKSFFIKKRFNSSQLI